MMNKSQRKKMKTETLIIDVRNQVPWHKRYLSNTTTAMLWGCWLFLWRPLVIFIGYISIQKPHLVEHFFSAIAHVLENGFTALLACAVSLWLWSHFIPSKTKAQAKDKSLEEYAGHFNLDANSLMLSRKQKIATVHHDADGKITYID